MKVLVVVPTLSSYLFLRELCATLVENGNEVHLASSYSTLGKFESDSKNVVFHSIDFPRGMSPLAHLKAARQLNGIVKQILPDVVDVHFSAAAFTAALAKTSSWPPILATVQGLRFPLARGFNGQLLKWAECWSASKIDKFIVLTRDDLEALKLANVSNCYLQEGFGFGCNLTKFDRSRFSDQDRAGVADKISKQTNEVVFMFIGRLVAFKGFNLVVRAFLQAYAQNETLKLVVCGEFDDYHTSGLESEELAAFESHLNIVNIGWTDTVDKYLSVADAVVFPSEREGVPVNLMEALSMGVPVITCDSRGCREVMQGGAHGVVLKERSSKMLAQAMLAFASDSDLRNEYSDAAFRFRDNFDRRHFVTHHIKAIEESVSSN